MSYRETCLQTLRTEGLSSKCPIQDVLMYNRDNINVTRKLMWYKLTLELFKHCWSSLIFNFRWLTKTSFVSVELESQKSEVSTQLSISHHLAVRLWSNQLLARDKPLLLTTITARTKMMLRVHNRCVSNDKKFLIRKVIPYFSRKYWTVNEYVYVYC